MSTEPRRSEAEQAMAPLQAAMPTVQEARLALGIHGKREGFRTITATFDSDEAYHAFGNLVRDQGVHHALLNSPGVTLALETGG